MINNQSSPIHHSWTIDPEPPINKKVLNNNWSPIIINHQSWTINHHSFIITFVSPTDLHPQHSWNQVTSMDHDWMILRAFDLKNSMQNPPSAESNLWKQIRKIQWWTNRWNTSEMPPNVSCRHRFCLSFFCLNFRDYLVETWIHPLSWILPPLWHWRKNHFIVFEHLKSAKFWISFLFAQNTTYDRMTYVWQMTYTTFFGTPTEALVDLIVPSCQPQSNESRF